MNPETEIFVANLEMRNKLPFLFKLASCLAGRKIRGAYRIYHSALRLNDAQAIYPFTLPDKTTLWAPLDWPGIIHPQVFARYEPDAIEAFSNLANQTGCPVHLIDCGADIGVFTRLTMCQLDNLSSITAIEPNPRSYAILEKNLSETELPTRAICGAVSNFSGYGRLVAPKSDTHAHAMYIEESAGPTQTPICRIDDLDLPPGDTIAMKVDVEGAETKVLMGAQRTLKEAAHFVLQIEAHPQVCRRTGSDPVEFLQLISEIRPVTCTAFVEKTRARYEVTDFQTPLFEQLDNNNIYDLVLHSVESLNPT
ncbi:MAG: FkbM family methyltransferase [Alphaproteobacteria bacterium]|nr:MAG: FkbM family methyltransferase [Alphaproteobacteria bacterium]